MTDRPEARPTSAAAATDARPTVSPWIVTSDTALMLDFVVRVFDAVELGRVPTDDGGIGHAEARIGDSVLLFFDKRPAWSATPALLRVSVPDGPATFDRALRHGATAVTPMTEMFWGDVTGRIRDPLGNLWWIQSHVTDLTPDEIAERAEHPEFIEAMRVMQDSDLGL